jgi:thioester reductase-like protein/predicted lipid carrier protein YhbT
MTPRNSILLTGATGLLGEYLLQELLRKGYSVAVLARDSRQEQADERVTRIVASWSDRLHRKLPAPLVLAGELRPDGPGLAKADRQWLRDHCRAVLHCAANLSFRENAGGEPWRTNVEGTRSLLKLCRDAGVCEWHQVSTAFVCGRREGRIPEEDLDSSRAFHNAYEESKFRAETLIRQTPGIQPTIYRPSIIVGDSRTGYTSSFNGLYRFLELAVRLASAISSGGETRLPLRLPLRGDEAWNLVPVDWVSQAIVKLLSKPRWHGRTYHLVSRSPVSTRLIRDVGAEILNISGVEFSDHERIDQPSRLEQMFLDGIREYWPYLGGAPVFACENTKAALVDLPAPPVDRPMLERLIRFAAVNRWGRAYRQATGSVVRQVPVSRCGTYIERVFPRQARRSKLAREARLDLTVSIDVRGPGGGQWSCKWNEGELVHARRGLEDGAVVTYHTDAATFDAIVNGAQTPQQAFFEERIAITGDLETALKLAGLFGQFLLENRSAHGPHTEVADSTSIQSCYRD